MHIGVDVGLLHHIFNFIVFAENGANGPVETLIVTAHENLVERHVTREHARDDGFVGELIGSFDRCCWIHGWFLGY